MFYILNISSNTIHPTKGDPEEIIFLNEGIWFFKIS